MQIAVKGPYSCQKGTNIYIKTLYKKLCCYIYLCFHAFGIPAICKNITQYSLGLLRQNCLLSGGGHLITHHGYSLCRPAAISVIGGLIFMFTNFKNNGFKNKLIMQNKNI